MPPEKAPLGSPARLQAPSQRLAVATTFFRVVDGAWSGWAKGWGFCFLFGVGGKSGGRGGGGGTRSVLKARGPGAFGPGPRAFCLAGRGAALGAAPRPPNAAAPPRGRPVLPAPPGNRRRAGGGALGNGERVAVGLRGGRRRFAGPKGPQNQSGGGGPCFVRAVRARRPPGAVGFSTGQTIHPPTLSAPASNKET